MSVGIWQFRLLVLLVWGLLVVDVAAPGYLKFWLPAIGVVDVRNVLAETLPKLHSIQ